MQSNSNSTYADLEVYAKKMVAENQHFSLIYVQFVDVELVEHKLAQQMTTALEAVLLEFCKERDLFVHHHAELCCMLWHRFSSEHSLQIAIKNMRAKLAEVLLSYAKQHKDVALKVAIAFELHNQEMGIDVDQMQQQLFAKIEAETQANMLLSMANVGSNVRKNKGTNRANNQQQ